MSSRNTIATLIVFIVAVAAGWYLAQRYEHAHGGLSGSAASTATSTGSTASSTDLSALSSMKPGQSITLPNGATITALPVDTSKLPPVPDLDRPFNWPTTTQATPEVVATAKTDIDQLVGMLKKDPTVYDNWISLGTYWKIAGDLEGANIAWTYATKVEPTVPVAYSNLADLNGYYFHDYPTAEKYFQDAMDRASGPDAGFYYIKTAQFYLDIKDKATALSVLQKGLKANPDNADLKNALTTVNGSSTAAQ